MLPKKKIENETPCRVCGGLKIRPVWKVGKYEIGLCEDCSVKLVLNPPTLGELEAHYASVSDPAYYEENRAQLDYYYHKLSAMIRRQRPNGKRIFDVGCSRGWFLDTMTGWDCHGNEINEFESREAQKRHGGKVVRGPFDTCSPYRDPFDVITIQDVLDHFIDPIAIIRKARSMLGPKGLLVIKVHDFSCLWAKVRGKKFYAVIPPCHLTYFTRRSLRLLCENNGFRIDQMKHYAQAITIPTIFFRLAHSKRDSHLGKIYLMLQKTWLRKVSVKKNFHDIITLFATKT